MRVYVLMFVFLMFSFCKKTNTKNDKDFSLKNNKMPYEYLYEYKDLYSRFVMVDCPDFIRFLKDGRYYIMNDCATRVEYDPRVDTIAETGKYKYEQNLKRLSFFNRKLTMPSVGQIFDTDLDTITLEVVRVSKDTLIFKESELDTLPIYFSRAK